MSSQSNFAKVKSEKAPSLDQVYRFFEIQEQNLFSQTFNNIFPLSLPVFLFVCFFSQAFIKIRSGLNFKDSKTPLPKLHLEMNRCLRQKPKALYLAGRKLWV